ncbi:MAG: HAD family hydrolase [Nanoarchaeota archaeon]
MIKAIIFDLWDTIGTKNIRVSKILKEHFKLEHKNEFTVEYKRPMQLHAWSNKEDMAKSFLHFFNIPVTEANIAFVKNTVQAGVDKAALFEGMEVLLNKLHEKFKLGLLSNSTIFDEEALKKMSVNHLFDAKVYSWQMGTLKPDKKNFDKVCELLHEKPTECLFIDNSLKHIEAAKALGMKTIHFNFTGNPLSDTACEKEFGMKQTDFKNIDQLKKELSKYSIN